jgi:hypothetical protein
MSRDLDGVGYGGVGTQSGEVIAPVGPNIHLLPLGVKTHNLTQKISRTESYTDKKEKKIFFIYKKIQMGSGTRSYMRKGFLIYEEVRKYLVIYEEAISHI